MSEATADEARMQGVLDRLEHVLAAENAGIGNDPAFDIRNSSIQKSRCLYELTQLSRRMAPDRISTAGARRLTAIRQLLAVNEARMSAHVDAVHAVAKLLKDAVQAAEADGTYSIDQFKKS